MEFAHVFEKIERVSIIPNQTIVHNNKNWFYVLIKFIFVIDFEFYNWIFHPLSLKQECGVFHLPK